MCGGLEELEMGLGYIEFKHVIHMNETDNNETTLRTRMHAESLDLHFRTSGHTQQQQCVQKARVWGPLPLPSVQVFTQGEATQKRAEWQGQHCL